MSFPYWMAVAVIATMPVLATAQDTLRHADPADPSAAAIAPVYDSAFKDYQAHEEPAESPGKLWRATNDALGRPGSDAGFPNNEHGAEAFRTRYAHQSRSKAT
jgi:hypothetical protein